MLVVADVRLSAAFVDGWWSDRLRIEHWGYGDGGDVVFGRATYAASARVRSST